MLRLQFTWGIPLSTRTRCCCPANLTRGPLAFRNNTSPTHVHPQVLTFVGSNKHRSRFSTSPVLTNPEGSAISGQVSILLRVLITKLDTILNTSQRGLSANQAEKSNKRQVCACLKNERTTTLQSVHAYSTFVGLGPTCRSTMEPTRSSNEGSANKLKLVTGNDVRMAIEEL